MDLSLASLTAAIVIGFFAKVFFAKGQEHAASVQGTIKVEFYAKNTTTSQPTQPSSLESSYIYICLLQS